MLAVSWYPPGLADEHGPQSDALVPTLLRLAAEYHLRICLHIEPYENRTVENLREHLAYVHRAYGSHPAYYRMRRGGQVGGELPVFYVYDSYRTDPQQWARLFSSKGKRTFQNNFSLSSIWHSPFVKIFFLALWNIIGTCTTVPYGTYI